MDHRKNKIDHPVYSGDYSTRRTKWSTYFSLSFAFSHPIHPLFPRSLLSLPIPGYKSLRQSKEYNMHKNLAYLTENQY